MEWRVFYRRGVPPAEKRTAVVQLADRNTVLIVQVSGMKSAYLVVAGCTDADRRLTSTSLSAQTQSRPSRSAASYRYCGVTLTVHRRNSSRIRPYRRLARTSAVRVFSPYFSEALVHNDASAWL